MLVVLSKSSKKENLIKSNFHLLLNRYSQIIDLIL